MRPQSVLQLLQSVQEQTLYPDEILIIDGSTNQETEHILTENQFQQLHYFEQYHKQYHEEQLGYKLYKVIPYQLVDSLIYKIYNL